MDNYITRYERDFARYSRACKVTRANTKAIDALEELWSLLGDDCKQKSKIACQLAALMTLHRSLKKVEDFALDQLARD